MLWMTGIMTWQEGRRILRFSCSLLWRVCWMTGLMMLIYRLIHGGGPFDFPGVF
jgi:hypothetical protein